MGRVKSNAGIKEHLEATYKKDFDDLLNEPDLKAIALIASIGMLNRF